jgi:hypothetical protein
MRVPSFLPVQALLLFCAALAGASAIAHAEVGPPTPEVDGVWRARGNWTVEAQDALVYENATVEVWGNLTIQSAAALTLSNITMRFPAQGEGPARISVAPLGSLSLINVSLSFNGTTDTVDLQGTLNGSRCDATFAAGPGTAASIRARHAAVSLTDCWVVTNASTALDANASTMHTVDCDFLRGDGSGADLKFAPPGSYVLDTTRFGALLAAESARVTLFATVRFALRRPEGAPTEGAVNGSGPGGELFGAQVNGSGTSQAVRLLWLDLNPAPARLDASARVAGAPIQFTAVGPVGGNTSQAPLDGHRVNVTVVLDRAFDVAVFLLMDGHTPQGPPLKQAFYLDLNSTATMRVRVRNEGPGASPPLNLTLTRFVLDPSSWAHLSSRPQPSLSVPALSKGQTADITFTASADDYGGKLERQTACFYSVSYSSAYRAVLDDPNDIDYGPWDDARESVVIAFAVRGNETEPCGTKGAIPLEWIAAGGAGAIAAVALLTHWASAAREERRAAAKSGPGPTAPDPRGSEEPPANR